MFLGLVPRNFRRNKWLVGGSVGGDGIGCDIPLAGRPHQVAAQMLLNSRIAFGKCRVLPTLI